MIRNSIKLDKLTFFGYHGVNDSEIKNGQNFLLDLSIDYKLSNNINDSINNTIDYIQLYNLIKDTFKTKRFNLLESLASKIIEDIKKEYPSVFYIKINIRKPSIVIDGNQDFINIEAEYRK